LPSVPVLGQTPFDVDVAVGVAILDEGAGVISGVVVVVGRETVTTL
jgi:hypothetical protein